MDQLNVIVWSDDRNAAGLGDVAVRLHPRGINATLAEVIEQHLGSTASVTIAGIDDPDQGLSPGRLERAEVLVWWGHEAHELVTDETVDRVHRQVLDGLGLVVLHSGHQAKIFRRLMGTSCDLSWREGGDEELLWTIDPAHPIAAGVEQPIRLGPHEMYGEPFDIPAPDALVFLSAFTGGEVFRSGCCFSRGAGRIFYFGPGHETYPVYDHPDIRRVIGNAVLWARPERPRPCPPRPPGESDPAWESTPPPAIRAGHDE